MASSLCKTTVMKLYQEVMDDVVQGVRELFLEDGVDDQVLQDLKQTWEAKILASKAVDLQSNAKQEMLLLPKVATWNGGGSRQKDQPVQTAVKQIVGQVPPNNHMKTAVDNKLLPVEITLPAQPGTDSHPRKLIIQVPASVLHDNELHKILTGPVISATMNLPHELASTVLQQHVNAALVNQGPKTIVQVDGADGESAGPSRINKVKKTRRRVISTGQIDGPADTSDEEDEASDYNEFADLQHFGKEDDEQDIVESGPEDEPLNSEDDVSEEDPGDLFDTENVVVCQYDKITRSRNKWKFHLKDGIMNLNGEDYVFQKATGDAEW